MIKKTVSERVEVKIGEAIFIGDFDENLVWLSIQINGGSARSVLTFDQAKKVVEAINSVIAAGEEAS